MADAEGIPVGAIPSITKPKRDRSRRMSATLTCLSCQQEVPRTSATQKRCGPCAREHELAVKRAEGRAKSGPGCKIIGGLEKCQHCGGEFPRAKPWQRYCKGCTAAARKVVVRECNQRYYAENKERLKDLERARYQANRDQILARRDCDEYRAVVRERQRKRYAESPRARLNIRMSGGIWASLAKGKGGRSWRELVDYTTEELARHLERQFVRGMTWENYGKWEIDHILPLSSFHFSSPKDPEFKSAWALTNLRPLWRQDNRSKHARRLHLI